MSDTLFKIMIGILEYQPGWHIVLDQIGAPWKTITKSEEISAVSYSVIIVNKKINSNEKKLLDKYLNDGGAILNTADSKKTFLNIHQHHKYFSSLKPFSNDFPSYDILDLYDFSYPGNGELISITEKSNGISLYLPFYVDKIITSNKSGRLNFYFNKKRLPNEIVRLPSNFVLRRVIYSILEFLHHKRELPFVHKWFFPRNHSTVFTFRIDSDRGTQKEIEEIYQISDQFKIPTTWFLDVKSHESWIDYFNDFTGQEIAVHCYEHSTYKNIEENLSNFLKAKEILENNKIFPIGVAAPRGKWNKEISIAMEKAGFLYTTEFQYDYDNFPSYPWLGNRFSNVLQLPVHPICPGSMRRQQYTSNDMISYYLRYIQKQLSLREPIALYHHPGHHYNEVLKAVFNYINEQNILKMSYSEYFNWWNRRNKREIKILYNKSTKMVQLETENNDNEIWFRISKENNKEIITSLSGNTLDLNFADFYIHIPDYKPPTDLMRIRQFDWRHVVHNIFDYWYTIKA